MRDSTTKRSTVACPTNITWAGWKDVAWRVWKAVDDDNANIVAAGVALFALLAIFPMLVALVSIYALFTSPEEMSVHVDMVRTMMPGEAGDILSKRLNAVAGEQRSIHGLVGLFVGIAVALWSAHKGVVALMAALNIAYDEDEKRGVISRLAVSVAFTAGGLVATLVVVGFVVAVPEALKLMGRGPLMETLAIVVRWVALWVFVVIGLALLYRWGPDRGEVAWRWITPGCAAAGTLWLIVSLLFSLYVHNVGHYGAIEGVIIVVLWFHLSAFVVVLGAELNAQIEKQPGNGRGPFEQQMTGPRRAG